MARRKNRKPKPKRDVSASQNGLGPLFDQFCRAVAGAGLEPVRCSSTHWQIRGGPNLVNFYPTSGTFYVAGTTRKRRGTVKDAIKATQKAPPLASGSRRQKRRADSNITRVRKQAEQQRREIKKAWMDAGKGCHWCGEELDFRNRQRYPTIDHRIPLARGGLDNANNIVVACNECNQARGHDMPELSKEAS